MDPRGTHITIDLYGVEDIGARWIDLLREIVELAKCRVLDIAQHVFEGGGRTAVLLLSSSHASVHTWPEAKYAALDLYSCAQLSEDQVKTIFDRVLAVAPAAKTVSEVRTRGNDAP